jgi:uncharacterized OsmC-like protein
MEGGIKERLEGGTVGIYTFKAESVLKEGLVVENTAGKFKIIADEPPSMRGTDTGMNPVEMLLCALGACQCITARFLARSQRIDLQDYRVELEGDLDPAGFMKGAEGICPGFQQVRVTVYIKANATAEEIDRFVALVQKRCPVGDTLCNGVSFVKRHIVVE